MLSCKIKSFIFIIIFSSLNLFAEEFFVDEPILNSSIYINIDGNKENEAIVFVHGLGDEASSIWSESVERLKQSYYVLTFDLPGFGKSSKSNEEYTPTKYAQILDYIVNKYITKPFYLVGHSMGGAIALKYAAMHQEKLKKLMIIDSAGILHKDAYGDFIIKAQIGKVIDSSNNRLNAQVSQIATNISGALSEILPKDLSSVIKDDRIRTKVLNSPTSIAALGLISEEWFDIYKIKTPTLIIWGENDDVTPIRNGYVLNYLLENSVFHIIKNSGHVPILTKKENYFLFLDSFLTKDIVKRERVFKQSNISREIYQNQGELKDCSYKYLRIINSNNLSLLNCNIQKLVIQNSNVSITDSKIGPNQRALYATNSTINITSSDIKGDNAMEIFNSKLDIAGSKIDGTKNAILSLGENKLIFSITTILSPTTRKIFHKKESMLNQQKY